MIRTFPAAIRQGGTASVSYTFLRCGLLAWCHQIGRGLGMIGNHYSHRRESIETALAMSLGLPPLCFLPWLLAACV